MTDGNRWAPGFGIDDEQTVLRVGLELAEIEPTPGFRQLMKLLQEEHDHAAQRFIKDENVSKKYARGYLAGIAFLLEQVPELIRSARELRESREQTGEFINSRIGGGSGSLA
jgi:hypothetical protein